MFERPSRGLLDFAAAALVIWAAVYHTPIGALGRGVVARFTSSHSNARPLLAYYTGGVYDVQQLDEPVPVAPVPDSALLATIPPGRALGRGVFAATSRLDATARRPVDALASRYKVTLSSPDDAATLVERAKADLGSDEAAVLAVFVGYDVASYAVKRSQAEGREMSLEALSRQLPPTSSGQLESASAALMLGTAYGLSWPVAPGTRVSSPFGWREHPILGRGQLHTGVDLSVPEGTHVKVVADGVVRRASEDAVNGRIVVVDHGHGVWTAYCHNSRLLVTVGQRVRAGDVVSESGNTGRSTGPHLHYQLELAHKPMDPFAFRGSKPLVTEVPAPVSPEPVVHAPPAKPKDNDANKLKDAFKQFGPPPNSEE